MKPTIYLDYAAATPLSSEVFAAMEPYFSDVFYNPSAQYQAAREVRKTVEDARARVAHWLGVRTTEIVFTAGATESINLAIHGIMRQFPEAEIAYSAIEHEAVRASAKQYRHIELPVLVDGLLDMVALEKSISDNTVLVSVGYANNEIGTIQPLRAIAAAIAKIKHKRQLSNNDLPLYLHTDASQAAMYLDLHASRLGVDLLTLNGGKMYGPKQTGILFVKAGTNIAPIITGGGQELGIRSGTENVAGAIGFATALDIAQQNRKDTIAKHTMLRDELLRRIIEALPETMVNGSQKKRLPNNAHVSWEGLDGERLLMLLDEHGVQAATGSACAANKQTASHVLQAIGLKPAVLQGSLRLTIGAGTTMDDVEQASYRIIKAVRMLRGQA